MQQKCNKLVSCHATAHPQPEGHSHDSHRGGHGREGGCGQVLGQQVLHHQAQEGCQNKKDETWTSGVPKTMPRRLQMVLNAGCNMTKY